MNKGPLVVSGMHRSGTSLVSRILIKNGVNLGLYKDTNEESIFFQRLNRWIMSCLGSSWDNPKNFNSINNNDLQIIIDRLEEVISSKFSNSLYFGFTNIFLNKNFSKYENKWGWKDPSNIYTATVWKNIFPDLKIINLTRNPIDVSISLLNRQSELKNSDNLFFADFISSFIPLLSITKGNILSSFNISTIDSCLSLYKKYLIEMHSNNNIFQENILNVKYEDLLDNPEKELFKIYEFCELRPDNIQEIGRVIDKKNLNKYNHAKYQYSESLLNELIIDF
tara:strand:+ start:137 stop:976 length:840 start_codon:yes stop_codon:yes gene_type:complete